MAGIILTVDSIISKKKSRDFKNYFVRSITYFLPALVLGV